MGRQMLRVVTLRPLPEPAGLPGLRLMVVSYRLMSFASMLFVCG
jgi:hypothetical protein